MTTLGLDDAEWKKSQRKTARLAAALGAAFYGRPAQGTSSEAEKAAATRVLPTKHVLVSG